VAHRDEDQARDEARSPSRSPYAPRTLQARDEASSPYTSPYTLQAGPAPCHRQWEAHRRWAAHRDEDQARDEARSPSRSPYAPRTLQARDGASSPYTSPYTLQAGPAPCHRRAVGRRAWEVARRAWAGAVLQGACRRREEAWEEAWEAEAAHQAVCRRRAALARLA
jgi:hypothetical protein